MNKYLLIAGKILLIAILILIVPFTISPYYNSFISGLIGLLIGDIVCTNLGLYSKPYSPKFWTFILVVPPIFFILIMLYKILFIDGMIIFDFLYVGYIISIFIATIFGGFIEKEYGKKNIHDRLSTKSFCNHSPINLSNHSLNREFR